MSTTGNPGEIPKSRNKVQLLIAGMRLQLHNVFYNLTKDPTCLLCGTGPEDRAHFLIEDLLASVDLVHIFNDKNLLFKLLLDIEHIDITNGIVLPPFPPTVSI